VIVHFVDIGGIYGHDCLNFPFITIYIYLANSGNT